MVYKAKLTEVKHFIFPPLGSNAGNGSFNTPWRNLEYAVTVAGAGDTIIMRGGTYFMNEVLIDRKKGRGGAPGQYLTIKNFSGEQPFLTKQNKKLFSETKRMTLLR